MQGPWGRSSRSSWPEGKRIAGLLAAADRLPAPERLERWLFLASEGGLDGAMPGDAGAGGRRRR